ncbi:helix-turn-helix domain-containing protein [Formosa sp. S-31]|uniref:helix-turn-helix domain-containing protein n=1 Tax=Formosa sp. S-31 TaxID=2790949 RepID=UPI003EBC6AA4
MEHIKEVLDRILESQYLQKTVLTFSEACIYTGISKSKMYKHTSAKNIPYYKPENKLIFFRKEELDQWLLRNRQSTQEELEREATKYSFNRKRF